MVPPNTLHAGPNSSITEKQEAIGVYGSRGYLLEQSTQNIFERLGELNYRRNNSSQEDLLYNFYLKPLCAQVQ